MLYYTMQLINKKTEPPDKSEDKDNGAGILRKQYDK